MRLRWIAATLEIAGAFQLDTPRFINQVVGASILQVLAALASAAADLGGFSDPIQAGHVALIERESRKRWRQFEDDLSRLYHKRIYLLDGRGQQISWH
jgi:hypothetical protein